MDKGKQQDGKCIGEDDRQSDRRFYTVVKPIPRNPGIREEIPQKADAEIHGKEKEQLNESAALLIVHFSGGSEDGSPRNKKPPAMPVRLSVFRSKQKNYLNVV
jgi:hypothetical protein